MADIKVLKNGAEKVVTCNSGENLYSVLARENGGLTAPCAGKGTCGKCKVKISGDNSAFVSSKHALQDGSYLACSVTVSGNVSVEIPSESVAEINTSIKKIDIPYNPAVRIEKLTLNLPTLSDSMSDAGRLNKKYGYSLNLHAMKKLPQLLREGKGEFFAAVYGNNVIDINKSGDFFMLAIDIGTTTVASCLIDRYGEERGIYSSLNPQKAFGADVISRIEYCGREEGLLQLGRAIRGEINNIIKHFGADISHITVAGNTTMLHLLLGVSPKYIANAPFIPAFTGIFTVPAQEIGINSPANITCLPSLSAYVGADITAGTVAVGLDKTDKTALLIDIGTNGEMVLAHNGEAVSCSTAAGPAFEGATISCGMGGAAGAVNKVYIEKGEIKYTTIGNAAPKGICGSGLIDAVAVFINSGMVDETGAISDKEDIELKSLDAVVETDNGTGIKICDNVILLQSDIREVQLAKSAICSGVLTMADEFGIEISKIDKLYLAGGFGSYLNVNNAAVIGLFPKELAKICEAVGNTSLAGAKYALCSGEFLDRVIKISENMKYIELSCNPKFNEFYMENMLF